MNQFNKLFTHPNLGLIVIRFCLGMLVIAHSLPRFLGGTPTLKALGESIRVIGLHAYPLFWGVILAFVQILGGAAVALGFLFRLACVLLAIVMGLTAYYHIHQHHDFWTVVSYSLALTIVFSGLALIGPGKWSVDKESVSKPTAFDKRG